MIYELRCVSVDSAKLRIYDVYRSESSAVPLSLFLESVNLEAAMAVILAVPLCPEDTVTSIVSTDPPLTYHQTGQDVLDAVVRAEEFKSGKKAMEPGLRCGGV